MAVHSVTTGLLACSFGGAPCPFKATPKPVNSSNQIVGNIMDNKPIANVGPFPPCNSPANPSNWKGPVFTPGPCVPVTPAPWVPGSPTVMVQNMPALNNTSKLMCIWGGVIQFTTPGQFTEMVP